MARHACSFWGAKERRNAGNMQSWIDNPRRGKPAAFFPDLRVSALRRPPERARNGVDSHLMVPGHSRHNSYGGKLKATVLVNYLTRRSGSAEALACPDRLVTASISALMSA